MNNDFPIEHRELRLKHPIKDMLVTERLMLKPYEDQDEDRMIELLMNEAIKETYIIPDFATREDAVSMFSKLKRYSLSDEHYELGIYRSGKLVGFVNDVSIEPGVIEIGYAIHPDFHNMGYASEMLLAVIEDLFSKGFETIVAGAFDNNAASFRVMEKCGMKPNGKEKEIEYHGRRQRCVYYEISRRARGGVEG